MGTKVTFISNYLTIHQISLCREFFERLGDDFKFVSSFEPTSEKIKYANYENEPFVIRPFLSKKERKKTIEIIKKSDIIIFGSGDRSLLKNNKKIIFFYSEHFSKTKVSFLRKIHLKMLYKKFTNAFLLCASCHSQDDFNSIGLFKDRCFVYGYFPFLEHFDARQKCDDCIYVLWAGRELAWKHPEYAFYAAEILHDNHINFEVKIVSTTNNILNELILKNKNEPWFSNISIISPMPNKDLQTLMHNSDIFILSSDKAEGWGAVVNEAMHAGCCPVVSADAGCSGYLINDGENGILFHDIKDFKLKLLKIIVDKKYKYIGENASKTIENVWNEKVAVANLCRVFNCILNKTNLTFDLINNGPGTKTI